MRSTGLRIKRGERRGQCVREGAEAAAGVTSLAAGRLREGGAISRASAFRGRRLS